MGITGLLPFLEKCSRTINISDIGPTTVAIDAYSWLHKGAFACADRLVRGSKTDIHIKYCLKYIKLLLQYGIKPILVFDGQHLPAKSQTERKRHEQRTMAKKKAMELLRSDKSNEALIYFRRCVNITHEMALDLIKECHKLKVDCIVAPYEADAQLAYLNKIGIADYIITEDSDLILFGCNKILFKLNLLGRAVLIESDKLYLSMGCTEERYTFDKFRYMCILSGCDYIDSLPGIGLITACKFILKTEDANLWHVLDKIPTYLKKPQLVVTEDYKTQFLKANAAFLHMIVYDPLKRALCRLNELNENDNINLLLNSGIEFDDKIALQMALGNINPINKTQMHFWNPDSLGSKELPRSSIWSKNCVSKSRNNKTNIHFQSKQNKLQMEENESVIYISESSSENDDINVNREATNKTILDDNELIATYNCKNTTKYKTPCNDSLDIIIPSKEIKTAIESLEESLKNGTDNTDEPRIPIIKQMLRERQLEFEEKCDTQRPAFNVLSAFFKREPSISTKGELQKSVVFHTKTKQTIIATQSITTDELIPSTALKFNIADASNNPPLSEVMCEALPTKRIDGTAIKKYTNDLNPKTMNNVTCPNSSLRKLQTSKRKTQTRLTMFGFKSKAKLE